MKFLRIAFFYVVFFLASMVVVALGLESWPVGVQIMLVLGVPGILVWVQERRRAELAAAKAELQNRLEREDREKADRQYKASSLSRTGGSIVAGVGTGPWGNATSAGMAQATRPPIEPAVTRRPRDRDRDGQSGKPSFALSRSRTGWVPAGETATVAGRAIGGMVYIGVPPRLHGDGGGARSRPYIDPSLTAAKHGSDRSGAQMPYWPGYSDIPPVCRATYLDWLADGRSDASYNAGYMFLYFYGLERRFLVDQAPEDERRQILAEVIRLQALYDDNRSASRYLGDFIEIAKVALDDPSIYEPVLEKIGWDVPFSMKVALGGRIGQGEALTADQLLGWFLNHPESRLRTAAVRCGDEFRALFRIRFDARFPSGLKVTRPRKTLKDSYTAASGEFEAALEPQINGAVVPDISGLRKPIEIAQEIAEEVMDDLDRLSRYLGRNPDGRGSLEAQALLPIDLATLFPSPALDALREWARDIADRGGLVPVADLIERLEGQRPQKLGARRLNAAADALAKVGYGIAPDPQLSLRLPRATEPVVVFDLAGVEERPGEVSGAYRAAQVQIALGAFVAHADGDVAEAERAALGALVQTQPDLTDPERARLTAELSWMLAVPPDMALLRRNLGRIADGEKDALRAAIAAMAQADGVIRAEEVAGIEKIYKLLDLDPSLAYSDLHAGVRSGPVTMRPAVPGAPGEPIAPEAPILLDAARIAEIRETTAQVSSVLGEIFGGEAEAEEPEDLPVPSSPIPGLDSKHAVLARDLILRPYWKEPEFEALAARHGLMPSGALETLNEWAFDAHGEALIDAYEGYHVEFEIAVAIMAQVGEEVSA